MNKNDNDRFIKFADLIGFEIPKQWKNTEIKNMDLLNKNNNDVISLKIYCNDPIDYENYYAFMNFVKAQKTYKIDLSVEFCNEQYTKETIISYAKKIIDKKSKWLKISKLNLNKVFSKVDNCTVLLDNNNLDFESEYSDIFSLLKKKLVKIGFKKLVFEFKKYNYELHNDIKKPKTKEWKKEEIEQIKKILEEDSKPLEPENRFKRINHQSFKKRFSTRSYKEIEISDIKDQKEKTNIAFVGQIFKLEKIIRNTSVYPTYIISVGDYKDAITCNWYTNDHITSEQETLLDHEKSIGKWIKIYASIPQEDKIRREMFVYVNNIEPASSIIEAKKETYKNNIKRVELHVSSKMNTMDSLLETDEIVNAAKEFNMSAVGIMDTDGVQSFPKFYTDAKNKGIKPIFGVAFSTLFKNNLSIYGPIPNETIRNSSYISFDIETTGLSPRFHEIIEFGAVEINSDFKKEKTIQFFIKPKNKINEFTTELTGITNEMLETKGLDIKEALHQIYNILNNKIALAHNARFDYNFLKEQFRLNNVEFPNVTVIDTLVVSRMIFKDKKRHKLEDVANNLGVKYDPTVAHRGDYDADVLANVWIQLINFLTNDKIIKFEDLYNNHSKQLYERMHTYEMTAIALNEKGIKNIYELVSNCLTKNFISKPITYVEDLTSLSKENLLIGSGSLKGRLLDKYFYSSYEDFIEELKLYDFIEIPAPQVFKHWIYDKFITEDELKEGLKNIIFEAKKYGKITVAISDAKYINTIDKLPYEMLVYAKGIKNTRHYLYDYKKAQSGKLAIPDLDFLTTQEMLDQFSFLNDEKLIQEIVIDNTNLIANKVGNIEIIKKDLYTPNFDNSDINLKKIVEENALKRYGANMPDVIRKRIDSELNPIIKYGFSVIYWISHKLVKMSHEQGYIVGSRGSVGSSLVATLSNVTDVNPLEPHYNCPNCQYFEFANIENITSGFDLPDKMCPKCGTIIRGDGQSIPFETFLGFNADKVPDIDLNFSGEFQSKVHDKIKELFGEDHTLRAGTIAKTAIKTAFGYVKSYCEETRKTFSDTLTSFYAWKLEGVKRTTGQHPGGIVIIPKEYDVLDFTPKNFPANDQNSDWFTTHFDYRSIHDNVLKLDILGHDNPTIIKMLERYTGVKIADVPKNDPRVLDLFYSTKELKIEPKDISGELTGALGLPEYGTLFVRQILREAQPKSFADLISICGLSHGTNVWKNNAQDLIKEKGLTIKDVISCRDDLMPMLMKKGLEPLYSFKIMEKVRKGKGLNDEEVAELKKHNVPNWQIDSMQKIEYMFPKAHAVAYATMAWWSAWFKLYYPLAHYAAYFSTHAKALDISAMIDKKHGYKASKRLHELVKKIDKDNKEKELVSVLEIVEEMYARGFYISNIDIEKSDSHEWLIDEKRKCLIPPFDSIDGLGKSIADSIIKNRNEKPYISKEDFKKRSGVTNTLFEKINDLGALNNLSDNDQFSLFG